MRRRQILGAKNEEKKPVQTNEPIAETKKTLPEPICPKCGKLVRRGVYMHMKWCKG